MYIGEKHIVSTDHIAMNKDADGYISFLKEKICNKIGAEIKNHFEFSEERDAIELQIEMSLQVFKSKDFINLKNEIHQLLANSYPTPNLYQIYNKIGDIFRKYEQLNVEPIKQNNEK